MSSDEVHEWRQLRMKELSDKFEGNAPLGRKLGYKDGAFVGQMIKGLRPITEKTVSSVENLPGCAGWFNRPDSARHVKAVDLDAHPDLVRIRKVKLRLEAGINGFAVDVDETDGPPIFFRADWLQERGFKPYALLAMKVTGSSMEPTLHPEDLVVANTADTVAKDGEVFAVNYEGEPMIKRLVRDGGTWWLTSDNPDQRRYPRKEWVDKNSILVGRIIHKQSERI